MTASPSAVDRIAITMLLGMFVALPLPAVAQDPAPKQPTAAEKLGAQPVNSREESFRRLAEEKERRDKLDAQKQADFERKARERQQKTEADRRKEQEMNATLQRDARQQRDAAKLRDKDARDKKAAELRDQRRQQQEINKGLRQGVDPNARPANRNQTLPSGYTSRQANVDSAEAKRRSQDEYLKSLERQRTDSAKRQQTEEDKKLRAARDDPNRDQAARDRRAKELRDERTINRELKKGPPQVQPLPADEAQRRTRDQQRQDDDARRKLEEERKRRGQG